MAHPDRDRHVPATLACVLVAIALRAWHIAHGLPDLTEEAFPFRHALDLWRGAAGRVDLNPHWFVYPSLTIYLQFFVQLALFKLGGCRSPADFVLLAGADPTAAVVLGRLVSVAADAVTIVFVGRIVRRRGAWAATCAMLLVAISPTMIRTARLIYADSVMCAFAIAGLSTLLDYCEQGRRRQLAVAASLIGAAIGSKYPAVVLVIPLVAAVLHSEQASRRWGMSLGALAIVALTFLLTTPYLLASWPEVARDVRYIGDATSRGELGSLGGSSLSFCFQTLTANLGWIGIALALASLRNVRPGDAFTWIPWLAWLVMFIPVAATPVLAERYLVPAIALGACLAATGAAALVQRFGSARLAAAGALVVALCAAQPAWSGLTAARAGRTTTQLESKRWCEAHVSDAELILSEAYGPALPSLSRVADVQESPLFQDASEQARAAYLSRHVFHLVWMPLLVGGYASVRLATPEAQELDVYPHPVDWNAASYNLRLLRGVDYVVTTEAVRGRFASDPVRFAEQDRFYAFLDNVADRALDVAPARDVEGPRITIYRLSSRAQAQLASLGTLDTLWWARTVPDAYRVAADSILRASSPDPGRIPGIPLWVQSLRPAYQIRYGAFADDLAENLCVLGRFREAAELARASLVVLPGDPRAASVYLACGRQRLGP